MAPDVYHEWLGVRSDVRPPDPHELLELAVSVSDDAIINEAAQKQLARLDPYAAHPDRSTRDTATKLMNEVARARNVLVTKARERETSAVDDAPSATTRVQSPWTKREVGRLDENEMPQANRRQVIGIFGVGAAAFVYRSRTDRWLAVDIRYTASW